MSLLGWIIIIWFFVWIFSRFKNKDEKRRVDEELKIYEEKLKLDQKYKKGDK